MSSAKKKLRAAVIGVGYLGSFHAQKYQKSPQSELVAVVDVDPSRAADAGKKNTCHAVTDYRTILTNIDVASIVVPPANHFSIARDCLSAGVHVLVEKPVTEKVDQAERLIRIAEANSLVLQVGHLERFNPLMPKLLDALPKPTLMETCRFSSYQKRGTEVDVVLDLMIHDIDILLSFAPGKPERIKASGKTVISQSIDIARANIRFDCGLEANLMASRVSKEPMRTITLYQDSSYVSLDSMNHELKFGRICEGEKKDFSKTLAFGYDGTDILMDEIVSFLDAVKSGDKPKVTGEDGKRALQLAIDISRRVSRNAFSVDTSP